jgi:hypothetical protein
MKIALLCVGLIQLLLSKTTETLTRKSKGGRPREGKIQEKGGRRLSCDGGFGGSRNGLA